MPRPVPGAHAPVTALLLIFYKILPVFLGIKYPSNIETGGSLFHTTKLNAKIHKFKQKICAAGTVRGADIHLYSFCSTFVML